MTEKERRISDLEKAQELLFEAIYWLPEKMHNNARSVIHEAMNCIEREKLEYK